ncbi:acyl-CoA dehydrogenase family protein [Streptomyces sp. NPDC020490]|uniref:acyl-CoA dehydrogenase family protein n=1 Tax=Streptomyces sp. NPDC020490 TaxID=3365078 RepID=UPI00379F45A4
MPSDSDVESDTRSRQKAKAELVARAAALRPSPREQAGCGETDRVVPAPVTDALEEAGVFRLLTPKRYGGLETDLRTLTEVSQTLGTADGSSAWTGTAPIPTRA